MPYKEETIQRIIYVNSLMREVNTHTDDMYEQLMDQDYEALHETVGALLITLKDVLKSHDKPVV